MWRIKSFIYLISHVWFNCSVGRKVCSHFILSRTFPLRLPTSFKRPLLIKFIAQSLRCFSSSKCLVTTSSLPAQIKKTQKKSSIQTPHWKNSHLLSIISSFNISSLVGPGGHLVSGSQMGGGGEAEFQGEGVGAVGYSDLVVVEDGQSLHSFSFIVKLQQTRQSLRAGFSIKDLELGEGGNVVFSTEFVQLVLAQGGRGVVEV